MHSLSLGDAITAERLLRRACALHAAPETLVLWQVVRASRRLAEESGAGDA